MMRAVSLLSCIALAAACARPAPVYAPDPVREVAGMRPLEASLLPNTGYDVVAFELSKPAYVAVFEVYRGGARLLYPHRSGELASLNAGMHRYFSSRVFTFASAREPRLGGAVTYLLLASEHPLNIAHYLHDRGRLRRDLEFSAVRWNEQSIISYLTDVAVSPGTADEAWTMDVWYGWSLPSAYAFSSRQAELFYAHPVCINGRLVTSAYWGSCSVFPPVTTQPPAQEPPTDTTDAEPPKPPKEPKSRSAAAPAPGAAGPRGVDGDTRVNTPSVDPTSGARGSTRRTEREPVRDVRAEPPRDRTPAVDRSRDRSVDRDPEQQRARRQPSGDPQHRPVGETRTQPDVSPNAAPARREAAPRPAKQPASAPATATPDPAL